MTAIFNEFISDLEVTSSNGLQDEVASATFNVVCEYRGEVHTNMFPVELAPASSDTFTDFASLTEDQVLTWVKSQIGQSEVDAQREAMTAYIDQVIEARQDEPVKVSPPWMGN